MAVALAGCGRTESYRYKLTLAVNTPEGVRRAASVVEVVFREVSIPERGITQKLRGEALYLDLGPGRRPLIALLTSYLHPKRSEDYGNQVAFQNSIRWTRDAGPGDKILSELYGPPSAATLSADFMHNVRRIAHLRGPHRITPKDLPDLVTFADASDPKSVILVDPDDLQATVGPNITWHEITLEMTNEPITTVITTKLPWLRSHYHGMLDGARYQDKTTLANTLSAANFESVDLIGSH